MKRVLSVLLLMCACFTAQSNSAPAAAGQSTAPSSSVPSSTAPSSNAANAGEPTARKARQLLDQMIAALGGQAWLSYKTVEQQGRSYSVLSRKTHLGGHLVLALL